MNSDTTTNSRRADLLKAFLNQVPGRINGILENWHQLVQGDWNGELLTTLLERLHTLAEASGKFQVDQISSSGQSLLSHLSTFRDAANKPQRDDLVALDGLVHAFRDAALEACQQLASSEPCNSFEPAAARHEEPLMQDGKLFLLGLEASVPDLGKDLEASRFQVEIVTSAQSLYDLQRTNPVSSNAVIAHIEWLKELFPDSREGGLWQTEDGLPGMPVAFIADTNDLQTRLSAMRTDAKAYWSLPIDPAVVASRMRELTSPHSHAPYRVLIVDDDPAQADFASAILSKAHFACRTVTEPLQVLKVLAEFKPDLILMDLYMPDASGCELTAVIRERSEFVNTPIVFLSGEQDLDKQLSALSCGGEDFLSKPIGPKHLIKTVTHRIRRANQLTSRLGSFKRGKYASGLNTRDQLFERVEALYQTKPAAKEQHAVLYLDIDNADEIVNRIGIGGMDAVLTELGNHLGQVIRPEDLLSRIGDHSLGMVASNHSKESLEALGKSLCAAIANQTIQVENHTLNITLSIGAYLIDAGTQDARSLFSHAKIASKTAHKGGGNQIHIQLPEVTKRSGAHVDSLAKVIMKAIKEQHFEIYFQPIVALKGASDEALYQALIRLQEPEGKLYTAAEFIPTAEQLGLIGKIDHWTTRTALSIINQHKQRGRELHLFVSQAADLLDNIERLSWLRDKHRRGLISENDLTFEFRLADVVKHLDSAKVCFEMLRSINIFTLLTGVNNSAESRRLLTQLPLKYVKLEPKLLNKPDQELKELISHVHTQKIKIIAPQVEDPRSIALLWSSGVDFVQGNFVQRPENNLLYDFNESVLN